MQRVIQDTQQVIAVNIIRSTVWTVWSLKNLSKDQIILQKGNQIKLFLKREYQTKINHKSVCGQTTLRLLWDPFLYEEE